MAILGVFDAFYAKTPQNGGQKMQVFLLQMLIFLLVHEVPSFEFGYINPYFFCIFY